MEAIGSLIRRSGSEVAALFQNPPATKGVVFMVHGFFGVSIHLQVAKTFLERDGWQVIPISYSSREQKIEAIGAHVAKTVKDFTYLNPETPVRYFTHSMGGVALRAAMSHHDMPQRGKEGKAVLLGPPLRGSEMARLLSKWKVGRYYMGEAAGQQLMDLPANDFYALFDPFPASLDIMIVVGSGSNPLLGPSDGVICVSETALDSPHVRHVLNVRHTVLPLAPSVIKLAREFLNEPWTGGVRPGEEGQHGKLIVEKQVEGVTVSSDRGTA